MLTLDEVRHVALLARLGLSPAEEERFRQQLSSILAYFQILNDVETGQVPPTAQVIALQNVDRQDVVGPSLEPEAVLANAPQQEEGHFRVKAVLE